MKTRENLDKIYTNVKYNESKRGNIIVSFEFIVSERFVRFRQIYVLFPKISANINSYRPEIIYFQVQTSAIVVLNQNF